MEYLKAFGAQTFASFVIPNFRRYFIGQGLSHIGNWMQTVALGWLVVELTGSGVALGSVLAVRFAPLLFGSIFAGNIVDSFDKRTLLYVTQSVSAFLAVLIGVLVLAEVIEMWMVFIVSFAFGLIDALDRPARQTFIHEMVGPEYLRNAVTLNSTFVNAARALGPLVAGVLIAGAGIAFCFFVNALSFIAFFIVLSMLRAEEFHREASNARTVDHVLAGLWYAASTPMIRVVLVTMAIIGTLTYEFQTTLPLLAHTTFSGTAADYAALLSGMGAGSVAGGLFSASRKEISQAEFVLWAFLFGVSVLVTALMPSLSLAVVALVFAGFFSIAMTSTGNTLIQLSSASHMRGRVMALWSMAIFGSTLIGAPIVGFLSEFISPRFALGVGAVAAVIAALYASKQLLKSYAVFSIPAFINIRREEASVENTRA